MHRALASIALAAALSVNAAPAAAQPVIDGIRDLVYGAAVAVQTVDTGFSDNLNELDAAYASCEGGRLSLLLTGNLEDNFNSLEIFIDSMAGGQTIYDSAGNGTTPNMDGLQFDAGFTADYHVFVRRGTPPASDPELDLDFSDLVAQSGSSYFDFLVGGGLEGTGSTGTGVNATSILVGYDDSNVGGVGAGSGAANQAAALAVTTGLELGIDLADLGFDGSQTLRVMVGINNVDHNFWSNQFLGGLAPPQSNLGGDGAGGFTGVAPIDFTAFAGNQFFVACGPAPIPAIPAITPSGMLAIALLLAAVGIHALRRA